MDALVQLGLGGGALFCLAMVLRPLIAAHLRALAGVAEAMANATALLHALQVEQHAIHDAVKALALEIRGVKP